MTTVRITINGAEQQHEVEDRTLLIHYIQADGENVTTVEGLSGRFNGLSAVQEGFRQEHGLQCGYCTPGMVMACTALLSENPQPTEHEIRHALEGNICRCTGYEMIVNSVRWAAENGGAQ